MDKTKRELLLEAAALLKGIADKEQAIRTCRAAVAKVKPGQLIEVQAAGQPSRMATPEAIFAFAEAMEAEIAPSNSGPGNCKIRQWGGSMKDYGAFIDSKRITPQAIGRPVNDGEINQTLFPFQRDLVRWAVRKGRSAIFADTGLGKTFMQIEWARLTGERTLILAPLTVARQTVSEAAKIGIEAHYIRSGSDLAQINVTNYEMLEHFDPAMFGSVVLDESSILKGLDGKTRQRLTEAFSQTRYRLCCTATPAPNDIAEMANHAEFLGVMTRNDMLATFFVHDDDGWRLKGHASEPFYRWMASWGMSVRKPSDLGYSDEGYNLPPLEIIPQIVDAPPPDGRFMWDKLQGVQDRNRVRKLTLGPRVDRAIELIKASLQTIPFYDERTKEGVDAHDLEAGVRREPTAETGIRPRLCSEIQGAEPTQGARSEEGIHGRLLQVTPGEIQQEDSGDKGQAQCQSAGNVRQRGMAQGGRQGPSQYMAERESGQREERSNPEIRNDTGDLQGDAGEPGRVLFGVRLQRYDGPELLSGCGPLPQDEPSSRVAVHELQHGAWEFQRQSGLSQEGGRLLRDQWVVWCGLNAEQDAICERLEQLGISFETVHGTLTADEKVKRVERWQDGHSTVIVSKPKVLGFGMNFQNASHMVFVGLGDSYEQYYQTIRRCWRFGQRNPVFAHVVLSEPEQEIYANVLRKEAEATKMAENLIQNVQQFEREEIGQANPRLDYLPTKQMLIPTWLGGEDRASA